MILADSSIWIDAFMNAESPLTRQLKAEIANRNVLMGDIILQEVLQGFRSDIDFKRAKNELLKLPQVRMLNTDLAVKAAQNYRTLRKLGVTIRKQADTLIATYCIDTATPLFYSDRDFDPFVTHLGLMRVDPSAPQPEDMPPVFSIPESKPEDSPSDER
jgi:predicted nucleic acid-binding protein